MAQVFSCEFCEISKNTFFTEHLQVTTSEHPWLKMHITWLGNLDKNVKIVTRSP